MIRGLDVSEAQGVIDWKAVYETGCRFAFVKAYEGNKGLDPLFEQNVAGAKAAGLLVGGYFFPYPLPHLDPAAQAVLHFKGSGGIGSHPGELPPVIDLEWPAPASLAWVKYQCTPAQVRTWTIAYRAQMRLLWLREPIVYTYPSFAADVNLASQTGFAESPLWLASYPKPYQWPADDAKAPTVAPWDRATFWQWTGGAARMPSGCPGDFDVFMGSEAELMAMCAPADASAVAAVATEESLDATDFHEPTPSVS